MGDLGSIPGLGRSPGEGNGYPFQYSGLENSTDYVVHGVTKSQTRLSDFHCTSQGRTNLCFYNQNGGKKAHEFSTKHCYLVLNRDLGKTDLNNLTWIYILNYEVSFANRKFLLWGRGLQKRGQWTT